MAITTYTIPAEKIVHNTSVDFSSRFSIINPIHIVQYDNSLPIISVELKNDNKAYTLPTGIEVWIRWKKKDNTFRLSRPCPICEKTIKDLGIKKVYYTNSYGGITKEIFLD